MRIRKQDIEILFLFGIQAEFIGKGIQYLLQKVHLNSIFWNHELLHPLIESLGLTWEEYVNSDALNQFMDGFNTLSGVILIASAFLLFYAKKAIIRRFLILPSSLIILEVIIKVIDVNYELFMLIEHFIIVFSPFIFILFYNKLDQVPPIVLKVLITATFLGHGCYAMGIMYPIPANFIEMTQAILKLSNQDAKTFLLIAGLLDVALVIGLYFNQTVKYALYYAIFWGFTTAFARTISQLDYFSEPSYIIHGIYPMVFRLVHGMIPLILLCILALRNRSNSSFAR